jgi:hypothetical protein
MRYALPLHTVFDVNRAEESSRRIGEVSDEIHRQCVVCPFGQFDFTLHIQTDDEKFRYRFIIDPFDK